MKKNSKKDYYLYCLAKAISNIVRFIPIRISVFFGRSLGSLLFYLLPKKRRVVYRNIKIAFPQFCCSKINAIARKTFMNSGQHFVEIFYMPWISERYIKDNFHIQGKEEVLSLLKNKKGAIFLGLHEGSWEIANVVIGQCFREYKYTMLVRQQPNIPFMSDLLNEYRMKMGANIIEIRDSLRPLVEHLKNGFATAMVIDHGAQGGELVNFFDRLALTPTGAMKFALKFDPSIILGFVKRDGFISHKLSFTVHNLIRTGDDGKDVITNLESIHRKYESYLRDAPEEYLWFFKRWKHSPQRNILVLNDTKAGHLKQSLAVVDLIKTLPFDINVKVVDAKFNNKLQKLIFHICAFFFGKNCQGCMWCIRRLFDSNKQNELLGNYYDAVISTGSSLAMLNRLIAFENGAKSIVVMRPGMFSAKRFDLVIALEHDNVPKFKNVISIKSALSSSIKEVNKNNIEEVIKEYNLDVQSFVHPVIGIFLGGSNKYLTLDKNTVDSVLSSLDNVSKEIGGTLLITTSRRTSKEVENTVKEKLSNNKDCKLLVIANEHNPVCAAEAILGLSDINIVSADSISMVSEAINSAKYTVVLKLKRKIPFLYSKHERFVDSLEKNGYIQTSLEQGLDKKIISTHKNKPLIKKLDDKELLLGRLKQVL